MLEIATDIRAYKLMGKLLTIFNDSERRELINIYARFCSKQGLSADDRVKVILLPDKIKDYLIQNGL